ncbi:MAG: hypothetical protein KAG61_13660 [Bacteriovoracaceae bacterium]|nr:hypothetical protein [Bacteriovoracaceae bacterium]
MDFYSKIVKTIKSSIFTDEDLKLIFCDKNLSQIHNSLSYYLKKQKIIKYKRGVYSLSESHLPFSELVLAAKLYGPSYISFESALSFHGLIPEAVYEFTSACFQSKKKIFKTEAGNFSYSHSPIEPFLLEVEEVDGVLIAAPIRALFDTVYKRKINYKFLENLESDLRIDLEELEDVVIKYSASEIIELGEKYKKQTTRSLSDILVRSFK